MTTTSKLPRSHRLRGLHFAVPGVFFTWQGELVMVDRHSPSGFRFFWREVAW